MKRIILFLIAFNFLNCVYGQWKTRQPRNHTYHNFYAGAAIGVDEILIGLPSLDYVFKYDDYFIQPYAGAHFSLMPLFALGVNKSTYAGINFKYISIDVGVGHNYLTADNASGSFTYTFWRAGILTKYGILKAGPSWIQKSSLNNKNTKIITINDQQWTVALLLELSDE